MIIAPSLLASDFTSVASTLKELDAIGVSWLHLDVMDGVFVETITFGPQLIRQMRPLTTMVFDTHLMITNPERHIKAFADAGSDWITFHVEATKDPEAVIRLIHSYGKKAGISVKPETPIQTIVPYLNDVDLVLIMSVEPGKGGQSFIPSTLAKLDELPKGAYHVSVDGGINHVTLQECANHGADVFVVGTYLFQDLNRFKELSRDR
jgi:ribulose-phosphate 3-epimerase